MTEKHDKRNPVHFNIEQRQANGKKPIRRIQNYRKITERNLIFCEKLNWNFSHNFPATV